MGAVLDPRIIRKIDSILHEPSRLSIVFALCSQGVLSFAELKKLLNMTDGNLSIHLRTLEESGYLIASRVKGDGKPRKVCRLSGEGRAAFERYLSVLEEICRTGRSLGGAEERSHPSIRGPI
jgi:DNA-binding MarR family transcriptional regulator